MNRTHHHPVHRWPRSPVWLIAALTFAAIPPASMADETSRIEHKVVRRPVVVLGGDEHQPVYTWSSVGNRSFLGVQTVGMTPELRQHFGIPDDAGVMVTRIVEDSPAAASGIEVGDILTSIDGDGIDSPADLAHAIGERDDGDTVLLEVWRDGQVQSISAVLAEREGPWVDIRQFQGLGPDDLQVFSWSDGDLDSAIEIHAETLNKAIEQLNEKINSPEWQERIYRFQEHQGSLMQRIDSLEQRLRELEAELEELPERE